MENLIAKIMGNSLLILIGCIFLYFHDNYEFHPILEGICTFIGLIFVCSGIICFMDIDEYTKNI